MQETQMQETAVLRVPSTMKNLVEALIFAAQEPLTVKQIKGIYEQGGEGETRSIDADEVRAIVAELNAEFQQQDKPYRILQIAGGFQFATLAQYAEWLGKLYKEQARRKLSQSSTETLAIIAYKQPIGRPEIEIIRGVNCDYVLATLLEKDLVTIVGRAPTPGRPLLYGTTREFLKHFGLNEITDLPRPREIEEILGESQFETERRMLEAQAGALETKKEEEDFKSRLPHIPKRKPDLGGEVKIVERKKQREIKTAGSQEQDGAKQADQEKLDF
ncbi:MAG: Segregation and condensation protein B, partial [Bacteroidetes bacterium]|nr:Segregation and condensation protein B [Bacteroidota bacterium]